MNNVPVEASLFQLAIEEGVRIVTKPDAKETDEEEEAMQIDDEDSISSTVGAEQEQPEFSGLVNGDVPMKEEEDSDCSQDQESVVTNDFFTAPSESSSLLDCSFFSLAKHDSDQEQDSRELENGIVEFVQKQVIFIAFLSLSFDGKSADEEDETTRMIGERIPPLDSDDEHEKRPVSVQYCEASHQGDYCPYGFWCGVIRNQKPAGVNAPNEGG